MGILSWVGDMIGEPIEQGEPQRQQAEALQHENVQPVSGDVQESLRVKLVTAPAATVPAAEKQEEKAGQSGEAANGAAAVTVPGDEGGGVASAPPDGNSEEPAKAEEENGDGEEEGESGGGDHDICEVRILRSRVLTGLIFESCYLGGYSTTNCCLPLS